MTLNDRYALYCRKDVSRNSSKNLNEARPILSVGKCRTVTVISGDVRFMLIFAEFPGEGASSNSGAVDNGNFQRFRWLFFRIL